MSYFDQIVIRDASDSNNKANINSLGELNVVLSGHVIEGNSTSASLAASSSFTGSTEEILDSATIVVTTFSDVASATDGLKVEWSVDGTNWDGNDEFTIPANKQKTFSFQPVAKYMRVLYTNGPLDQSVFRLQTIVKHSNIKPSSHRIQDPIIDDDDAELVKSVLTAKRPDGSFVNIDATRNDNLRVSISEYGDTPAIDSFGRLRISEPFTLFDSKQLHDKQPLFWSELTGSGATSTHDNINACTQMTVPAVSGSFVIRQTKQRFNYQPAKSQLTYMTFQTPQVDGVTCRVGLFDGTGSNQLTPFNGIFFECDGNLSWNICKNGTITERVSQSQWNVDTMDGSGNENNPSGIQLNMDAPQILIIDYEWLGVGRVRCGFIVGGLVYYTHYFYHANNPNFNSVYMTSPNLPLRYSIQTNGVSGSTMQHICSSIMSEGGIQETGMLRSFDNGVTHVDANVANTTYAILGIRLKQNYFDIPIVPEYLTVFNRTDSGPFRWSLQFNPTVAGTFTYNDVANSSLQQAVGATANTVTTPGIVIDSGYVSGVDKAGTSGDRRFLTQLRIGKGLDDVRDTIVVCVTPLTVNADILASLTVREFI